MEKLCLKITNLKFIFLLAGLLFQVLFISNVCAVDLPKIKKVELIQDNNSSKVVINLTKQVNKLPLIMATLKTVSFDLGALLSSQLPPRIKQGDGFVDKVLWYPYVDKTTFEIKRKYYSPVNVIKQDKSSVIIIELPRNYFNKESQELKPGIVKHLIRTENKRGPVVADLLEIDLANENISVKVGLPNKKNLKTKDTLTNIVKGEMAFLGINANYFDVKVGNPLGVLVSNGEWLVGPVYDRAAIGFTDNKKVLIDKVMLTGSATIYRGFRKKEVSMFDIDGFNTPVHLYSMFGFFNSKWDEKLDDVQAAVVKKDCIKKITKNEARIMDDGYIIASKKDISLKDYVKKRDCLKIEWKQEPDWSNVKEAISGGPYLLMDGGIFVDDKVEHIKFAKKETYAPRSAIGIGKNGNLYLITVDGRNNGYSVGLTLKELAELLKKLDLKDAINLDGGGSTELVIDGKIINKLSEHHERKIANALLIFYKD